MTATVQVARFHGVEDFRFDDVPAPIVGPDELKVEIAYNGICGTDVHLFYTPETSGVPIVRDEAGQIVPVPVGHEFAGTVVEVGSDVDDVRVGDRVAVYPIAYCGECEVCRSGAPTFLCPHQGMSAGGVGESIVIHRRHAHLLPDGVDLVHGALVEPMAVASHAIDLAAPGLDSTVVVAGAGPIGIGVFLGLRARGVEKILVSEPHAGRRAVIGALGARTIDPLAEDLAEAVRVLSGGAGAAAFFDAAGVGSVFAQGLEVLGFQGQYVLVAVHAGSVSFEPWPMQISEKRIISSMAYRPEDFDRVIEAMARGAYPTEGWVTIRPEHELVEVIGELRRGEGTKVLLRIG